MVFGAHRRLVPRGMSGAGQVRAGSALSVGEAARASMAGAVEPLSAAGSAAEGQ